MALDFVAANRRVTVSADASIDDQNAFTWIILCRLTNTAAENDGIVYRVSSPGGALRKRFIFNSADALQVVVDRAGGLEYKFTDTGFVPTSGWVWLAMTWDESDGVRCFKALLTDSGFTEATYATEVSDTGGTSSDGGDLIIGNSSDNFDTRYFQGDIARFRQINRRLPLAELDTLLFGRPRPDVDLALWHEYGFSGISSQVDWSGNGNVGTMTGGTIASHAPVPPIFGYDTGVPYVVSVGPNTISPTGSILGTGLIYNTTQNFPYGDTTPVGTVFKSALTSLVSSISPIAVNYKEAQKTPTGDLSETGVYQTTVNKLTTSAISINGNIQKQISKIMSSSIDPEGALVAAFNKVVSFAGSLDFSGVLYKQANKIVSGSSSLVGTLNKTINNFVTSSISSTGSTLKTILKTISSSILATGSSVSEIVTGITELAVVGAIALGGTINNTVAKTYTGSIDFISGIEKLIKKTYNSSVSGTGVLLTSFINGLIVAGSLDFSGILYKRADLIISSGIDFIGTEIKEIRIGLSAGLSSTGSAIKQISIGLSSGIQATGAGIFTKIEAGAVKVTTYLKGMFRGMFKGMK